MWEEGKLRYTPVLCILEQPNQNDDDKVKKRAMCSHILKSNCNKCEPIIGLLEVLVEGLISSIHVEGQLSCIPLIELIGGMHPVHLTHPTL